jgi:hypothetical protein
MPQPRFSIAVNTKPADSNEAELQSVSSSVFFDRRLEVVRCTKSEHDLKQWNKELEKLRSFA